MSLADQPAYLQPRIRHITSIRIHRLTIEHDDIEDAIDGRGQQASPGLAGLNGTYRKNNSTIEGYDLAVSQKVTRPKPVDGQVCRAGISEQVSTPVTEDGPEPIECVINHIVEDEIAAKGLSESDARFESNESLRRNSSRDIPELQFRRNRRRTSQSDNSITTLRVLQETVETSHDEPHGSDLGSPLSPNPASNETSWPGSDSQRPASRHIHSSRSGSFTQVSVSPQQGTGGSPLLRRPSLSMNRSRSRLTIPRHVDRAKSEDELRSTSPLLSPASPAMDGTFPLNYSSRPAGLGGSLRSPSISSFRRQDSIVLEEKDEVIANGLDIDVSMSHAGDPQRHSVGGQDGQAKALSQSVQAMQGDLDSFDGRARSTSVSSARTSAPALQAASYEPSALLGARTSHRRERSATITISSHSLDPLLPPPLTLLSSRPNLSTLASHPEEEMRGLPTTGDQHTAEEVTYVNQRILRNRLVRCFITFASVERGWGNSSHPPRSGRRDAENPTRGDSGVAVPKPVSPKPQGSPSRSADLQDIAKALTPFYISPIHVKSTHPTFSGLTPRSDYANWLSTRKAASHKILVEVWVELDVSPMEADSKNQSDETVSDKRHAPSQTKWRKLKHVGGIVDLRRLQELEEAEAPRLPENTLIFNFNNWGDRLYYFESTHAREHTLRADSDVHSDSRLPHTAGSTSVRNVMERSLRETKMRYSMGLGELHHMMNLNHVIQDTELDVQRIARDLNARVTASAKFGEESRACSKQAALSDTFRSSLTRVESDNEKTRERIRARRSALRKRRDLLGEAKAQGAVLTTQHEKLKTRLSKLTSATQSLQIPIYHYRSRRIATIDEIFEISPTDAPSLLYSILKVPLPIPQHPSEAAPPLSLPSSALPRGVKVDEDTISTALGYVAMAVNQISHIWERPLHYPVTCAGSKSLVKDNISIIQGPRSFPLYAKGVEKYRYDYAVFLLNKNIELLMVDAGIKLEDMRHTLPNLKMLLLTLAAQDRPPAV